MEGGLGETNLALVVGSKGQQGGLLLVQKSISVASNLAGGAQP